MEVKSICFSFLLILVSVHSQEHPNSLRDVWHYDQGVARISNAQFATDKPSTNRYPFNQTVPSPARSQDKPVDQSEENLTNNCDLHGQHIRVAVSHQPPLVNCNQDFYGEWACNGSNIEVIRVLERRLNFHADWIVLANNHLENIESDSPDSAPPNHRQARRHYQKRPTDPRISSGVLGLVSSGRAWLSANGFMRNINRNASNLLVTDPFDSFRLHILLSKSVRDHDHIFIKPFNLQSWIAILASAVIIVPIFYLINTTSAHYYVKDDRALSKISLWTCGRHVATKYFSRAVRVFPATTRRRRYSSASSSTTIDREIDKMVASGGILELSQLGAPIKAKSTRERRLLRRRWNFQRKQAKKAGRMKRKSGFFKVAYIVWYVVSSLANQGGETEDLPHASSTRILIAFWWLYLIVICAMHSGILTAILTFPKQNDFIQTLDDYLNLKQSERMKLTVDKYSELAALLSNSENLHKSPLQTLLMQSIPIVHVDFQRHRQRILDDVQQGRSAFMEDRSTINQIITQEYFDQKPPKCQFKASRFPIDVIPMSLVVSMQSFSPICVNKINTLLKHILRTGLAQKWRRKYDSQGNDCLNTVIINAGDVDKIELKHVILAFWLLLVGAVLGSIFLVGEIIWLFMNEDENEEESDLNSSLSSSSWSSLSSSDSDSSSLSDNPRLGHKGPLSQSARPIRTMQNKFALNKRRRRKPTKTAPVPQITFSLDQNDIDPDLQHQYSELEPFDELQQESSKAKRRRRKMERAAERRSRRLQRTLNFIKRVHGGKVYSDKMRNRVRRASHAIVGRLMHGSSSIGP